LGGSTTGFEGYSDFVFVSGELFYEDNFLSFVGY
jgi:hypothetical protein